MTIQTISHCGDALLVGVNGKDIFGKDPITHGEVYGETYIGYSGQQINDAAPVKEFYPCPVCGEAVRVESIKPTKQTVVGR